MRVWRSGVCDLVEVEEARRGDVAGFEDLGAGALFRIVGQEPGAADWDCSGGGGEFGGGVCFEGG